MSWRPGKAWPTQAEVTYLAALITVIGAIFIVLRWISHGRKRIT